MFHQKQRGRLANDKKLWYNELYVQKSGGISIQLVIASNNKGKIAEFKSLLAPLAVQVLSLSEAGALLDAEETGITFEENAAIKARAVFEACGGPVIADDSGLVVDALGGAPGVYSARYGGEGLDDIGRYELLLRELAAVPEKERTARFVSVICYIDAKGTEHLLRGECEGSIAFAPSGAGGFGYDPVFITENGRTMGEISPDEKNAISHRGRALRKLLSLLREKGEAEC